MKLFTYCMKQDTGASPNPYDGLCSLVLTKPVIRRTAEVGDWVVGLASGQMGLKNANRKVIFAMKITQIMNLEDYDMFCRKEHQIKIPQRPANTYEQFVGDCVYEFMLGGEAILRPGVHDTENMDSDLKGENALLSEHFYYFGNQAPELPENLWKIIKKGHGHQLEKNAPYISDFEVFIRGFEMNEVLGAPINKIENWYGAESKGQCSSVDLESNEMDEKLNA